MTVVTDAIALPPIREEIGIFPGPTALDGSPTWTLHDPSAHRFYRLGWQEFEIVSRWHGATIDTIVASVNTETTLAIEHADVDDLRRYLFACDLLRVAGSQLTPYLLGKARRLRPGVGQWLLHNYLFMRIPLLRPDRFLTATYPYVRGLFSRSFALAIVSIASLGVYLVIRQWDVFLSTFVDLFTVQGAVWFALALSCLKIVHELGHAYTAKRFGCRVPTMGLALLVMVPVLYTDVNESWKLTRRRERIGIGIAGVTAELACAAIAMCAWGFLPTGPARSAAFVIATSTWVTTVLINMSPFMRYDGYYVLSDWLETPNLHARAFALGRWWLREVLIGLKDRPPEDLPKSRERLLVAFAFLTWLYRFALFLGIAAIIYHFAVKAVGIAMMAVEIGYFLVRPVASEFRTCWLRRADMRFNVHTVFAVTGAVALVVLLVVPWRSGIQAPAVLRSREHVDVFAPEFGSRIASVTVADLNIVGKGAVLMRLVSPDLDYKIAHARADIDAIGWRMSAKGFNAELLTRSLVTEQDYETSLATYRGLLDLKEKLSVVAPVNGEVVDIAEDLEAGQWIPAKSRLASIIDPKTTTVEAYIEEGDLDRIRPGDTAQFFAEADSRNVVALNVVAVARASTRVLSDPYLASIYGGPITVRTPKQNELVPDQTYYRVTLTPSVTTAPPKQMIRGRVALHGDAVSIAQRTWRLLYAVFIRESGA
jgi:putative peptide zinc metalloprotease protein